MALANRSITPPSHPARATTVSRQTGGDPLRTFLTGGYKLPWAFREAVTAATCG